VVHEPVRYVNKEYICVKKEELISMFKYLGGNTVVAFVVKLVARAVG
jgi:hypothetical protein